MFPQKAMGSDPSFLVFLAGTARALGSLPELAEGRAQEDQVLTDLRGNRRLTASEIRVLKQA